MKNKKVFGLAVLALILVIVGATNYILSALSARVDLTAEQLYTLSPGSKAVLAKLDRKVTLKFFFSEGITNEEGEEVSTREIKKILKDAVENEDKANPMTDEQLMFVLKEKGYPIARRTVAKYREQLGIPVGRMRKKI